MADKFANDGGKKQIGHWVISEYHGTRRHDTFQVLEAYCPVQTMLMKNIGHFPV